MEAPPARFELAHPAPEADALSPELWGLTNAEMLPARGRARDTCAGRTGDAGRTRSAASGRSGMQFASEAVASRTVTHGLGRGLVVDDDGGIRQLIAVNLTLEGVDGGTADGGEDCIDRV